MEKNSATSTPSKTPLPKNPSITTPSADRYFQNKKTAKHPTSKAMISAALSDPDAQQTIKIFKIGETPPTTEYWEDY